MKPTLANEEGEFEIALYQSADNLVEPLANSPVDVSDYECAVIEARIPRLMWAGFGIGISYKLSPDDEATRLSFRKEWFSSLGHLVNFLNLRMPKTHTKLA